MEARCIGSVMEAAMAFMCGWTARGSMAYCINKQYLLPPTMFVLTQAEPPPTSA